MLNNGEDGLVRVRVSLGLVRVPYMAMVSRITYILTFEGK